MKQLLIARTSPKARLRPAEMSPKATLRQVRVRQPVLNKTCFRRGNTNIVISREAAKTPLKPPLKSYRSNPVQPAITVVAGSTISLILARFAASRELFPFVPFIGPSRRRSPQRLCDIVLAISVSAASRDPSVVSVFFVPLTVKFLAMPGAGRANCHPARSRAARGARRCPGPGFYSQRVAAATKLPGIGLHRGDSPTGYSGRLACRLTVYWSHVLYVRARPIQPDFAVYFTSFATLAMMLTV